MLAAHVSALMDRDPLATMEDFDRARGDANIDFRLKRGGGNRVEEVMDLDMIVEVDPRAPPFRELRILGWQAVECGALDLPEQLEPAQAEMAHGTLVHALHHKRDRRVAFGEREEGLRAQPSQNVRLRKSDAGFDFRLISRLVRPRRKDSHRIMRSHRAVGSVDLGIVERRLVDAALQIVGNQQLRRTTEEAEHAHMSAGPVRQLLRPRRLGTGEVRGAEYADEYLSLVDFTRRLITNRDPLARVVHERLFAGDVVLAHHRTQPSLKTAKQIAEPAIAVALLIDLPIFLPQNHHRHAGPLQLARQSGSVRRRWPVSFPARPNSRSSRASSVISSPSGHASPAAAARFRLSWTVDRATPRRRPISRALTPP